VITRLRSLFQRSGSAREPLSINDVVREVIAIARLELQNAGVTLRTYLDDAVPSVLGDRVQLQQLLLNLILNAAEAMSGVKDRPRELVLKTEQADGVVRVAVRDSGVGLEATTLERIFDPFYSTKSDGMGMGLAISRSIAENHSGLLMASSHEGAGATFVFTIPSHS
jgi:signal transduction histidine kinase